MVTREQYETLSKNYLDLKEKYAKLKENAIIIPENATNEQVLDAVLPDFSMFLQIYVFTDEWLKKSYIRKEV